ncbi:MAG TPA: hypothetical protein VNL70_09540 [Tepidisphaeraceae bacterium]|nr:hypothetical protein [Tepidisphaeraceae bacterium]
MQDRAPAPPDADFILSEHGQAILPEDDLVPVPPPSTEMFLPKPPASGASARSAVRRIELIRTLIPILLTGGVMLAVLGGLWFTTEPDSPFRNSGIWLPWTLIGTGLVLFVVGLLNALHVRHLMQQQADS